MAESGVCARHAAHTTTTSMRSNVVALSSRPHGATPERCVATGSLDTAQVTANWLKGRTRLPSRLYADQSIDVG